MIGVDLRLSSSAHVPGFTVGRVALVAVRASVRSVQLGDGLSRGQLPGAVQAAARVAHHRAGELQVVA